MGKMKQKSAVEDVLKQRMADQQKAAGGAK
jgi:hypothetical protein